MMNMLKIYLDPGHGGSDPGATFGGILEKVLTLKIALKIRDILAAEYEGVAVKLSRSSDKTMSLTERTKEANSWGADYLSSIHINAGGGKGFEIFTYDGDYNGKANTNALAETLHDEIINETGFTDRGCKEADFHMVRESTMSASLTENGFIDNAEDLRKLNQDSFITKVARGHVNGYEKMFDLKRIQKRVQGKRYEVIAGTFTEYENAQKREAAVQAAGIESYIKEVD